MGLYGSRVLPRLVDLACGTPDLRRLRAEATTGLSGTIVEIGFGSGLNLPEYPVEVVEVLAVEPEPTARALAAPRIAASPAAVRHIGLDGASIPLDDDTCDGALSTFTLCTIPDVHAALAEVRRVLRPGAPLHFLEHGLSTDPAVARWQHRLEPVQKRVAGGCHLTRDAAGLVTAAGFRLESVERRRSRGPAPWTCLTLGVAVAVAD